MGVQMIGINFRMADVRVRGLFSFTKDQVEETLESLKGEREDASFLLLSTCNRTELWAFHASAEKLDLGRLLCHRKGLLEEEYGVYFERRDGMEAMKYLFRLTAGLESQIFGEDQIVSQVKTALSQAREAGSVSAELDKLFLTAVTAAKKVKTEIRFRNDGRSVMDRVMKLIKEQAPGRAKLSCLVIGNGEMGRLAAETLCRSGHQVTMTVRQYHKGEVRIPHGCDVVPYEKRFLCLKEADIVLSATQSPHHTLHFDDVEPWMADGKRRIFIDLAVPRDISDRIKELKGVVLYDMDGLGSLKEELWDREQHEKAQRLFDTYISDYMRWMDGRRLAPRILERGKETAEDALWRLEKAVGRLPLDEVEKQELQEEIAQAVSKSVSRLLFDLAKERDV